MGWSREEAIAFMMKHLAFPRGEIENEVDRYIVWPGQALAYMLGRMTLQELRTVSERRLGDAFNLKEFHDVVLSQGAVPLPVLRLVVEGWLKGRGV